MKIKIDANHVAELFPMDLQHTTFKVFCALIVLARTKAVDGVLTTSDAEIAELARCGAPTTMQKCLFEIKARGYIVDLSRDWFSGRGKCNVITFHERK